MKQVFLLITTLATLTVQAQKILIGYNFSAGYSFRNIKNSDGSTSNGFTVNSRNDIEVAKFGYSTGLNFCLNVSKYIAFETGIQYSNKGYQTKKQDLIYFPPNPSAPVKAKFSYAYQYLGIPLKAKFFFGKSNLRFVAGIGFTTSVLLNIKNSTAYEYAGGNTEKKTQSSTSGFNKVDLSPMISAGIDYKLSHKMHVFAEPEFRYGLINTKDATITEKLWSAGLNVGFYYVVK